MQFCGFVMLFCTVSGVYIPVFLCGFAVLLCYSVRCLVFIYRYFCAVLRFSYVIMYGVYIPVFLCGFAVFVTSLPPPPLFRLLSDLKFCYMHVKVSILKPILVFSSMQPLFQAHKMSHQC